MKTEGKHSPANDLSGDDRAEFVKAFFQEICWNDIKSKHKFSNFLIYSSLNSSSGLIHGFGDRWTNTSDLIGIWLSRMSFSVDVTCIASSEALFNGFA